MTAVEPRRAATPRLPAVFWLLFAGTLLNRLGVLVPAFLSLYLSIESRLPLTVIGILVGAWGAGSVVGSLLGGALADRWGPRATIVAAQALTISACSVLAVSHLPAVLGTTVLLSGCASTLHRPAGSVVVFRTVAEAGHVRAFGLLYWAWNIGAAISPAVSGALLEWSPMWLLALNVVTALAYGTVALLLPGRDDGQAQRPAESRRGAASPFRTPRVARFLLLSLCLAAIYLQKQSTLPMDMAAHGLSPHEYGLVVSLNGLMVICLQPLVSRIAERIHIDMQFVLAGLLVAVGFGANAVADSPGTYALALAVWTLGEILLVPQAAAFMIRQAPPGRAGSYQGAYQFVWNLGLVLGAPAGMAVMTAWSSDVLWIGCFVFGLGVVMTYIWPIRKVFWNRKRRASSRTTPARADPDDAVRSGRDSNVC